MSLLNENLLQQYENVSQNHFRVYDKPWLAALRKQSWDAFLTQGFPTTRDEDWKYTNLSPLNHQQFHFATTSKNQNCNEIFLTGHHYRLVFVDGFFNKDDSIVPENENYIITNLATAMQVHEDLVQTHLSYTQNKAAFVNLNTACIQDGVFIYVPENCIVQKPIQLIFISSAESKDNLQNIRNVIVAKPHANFTVIEEHQSFCNESYIANILTQIDAHEDSKIEYCKLQYQNNNSFHFGNIEISQEKNSQVLLHSYSLGSQLARDNIYCYLNEPGASVRMQGLYLPFKKQHIDLHTYIYHQADHTSSEELFKGVIAGKSAAVFNGKIYVEKNIKQAVANLQNKNLLLARDAKINTKPELEIYASDVKCRHGATIGQIDQEMLFYLRSRGILQEKAYELLLLAFVREHLNVIYNAQVSEKILSYVTHHCEETFNE